MSPPNWNRILNKSLNNNSTNIDIKKLLIEAKHKYSKKKREEGIQIVSSPIISKHKKSQHKKSQHKKSQHKKPQHKKSQHKKPQHKKPTH